MKGKKKDYILLKIATILIIFIFIFIAQRSFDAYIIRILNLCGIYVILGVSLNLINGFTGQFSLGHAGFMAIGAYVSALLYTSPEIKEVNYFITPLIWPLNIIQIPFIFSLIMAGLVSAGVGFLVGAPCLRLKGDYLAIVTFGFSEIIRVLFCNLQSITNGPLGLKGLPSYTNLWWTWGIAIFTVWFIKNLINSSYGRALKSIREDEIAAEAMGVKLFYHKVLSFIVGAFFAGIAGALLGSLVMTIDPNTFSFFMTFQIIIIVVVGGLGSITGTVIVGALFAILMEVLRSVESPMSLFGLNIPGIPGMRMLLFSILLMIVVLFFHQGLMGTKEWSWEWLYKKLMGNKKEIEEGS
ncbi:branched-chain amino acid ABC transporter permease [Candidatus Infernicultor aquiphilus]|uniref:branched-chain amino acid ABC transporter permease n=1 Tax=Candidatus Infernicultor aquiphilus TaxID=1805029 RepID=UPI000A4BB3D2